MNLIERFEAKVSKSEGCWLWKGAVSSGRYGNFNLNGKFTTASRAAWILYKGEIPDGLFVCHTCDNPLCVKVDHLFLGTPLENILDCIRKGRGRRGSFNLSKTHCPKGHPYDSENTIQKKDGSRGCKMCEYASVARWYKRKKEMCHRRQPTI